MPELPEVETVVRSMRPEVIGKRIDDVWTSGKPLRLARKVETRKLKAGVGRTITAIRRKGKYILIDLDHGGGVLVHLGMSGRLRVQLADEERAKHTHVVWSLPGGREIRFIDPRRFGWVEAALAVDALPEVCGLGPDPLADLDATELTARLASSRAPIKAFLLDQRRVAGLGNIYVCEALFRAGIHPSTEARRVRKKAPALLDAIRTTLEIGIANCGTTFRDFVSSTGEPGRNIQALLVYGREGKGCTVCRQSVRRQVDSGRSTFYCARCQRR